MSSSNPPIFLYSSSGLSIHHNDVLWVDSSGVDRPTANIISWPPNSGLVSLLYADTNLTSTFSANKGLDVNPAWVSPTPGSEDYHLGTASPLVGQGAVVDDSNWGTIQETDLGAYQAFPR